MFECLDLAGHIHAVIDKATKEKVSQIVFKDCRATGSDGVQARSAILGHEYLKVNNWSIMKHQAAVERHKKSEKIYQGFLKAFKSGRIQQKGLEQKTGDPQLTEGRLRTRWLLEVAPGWLLLEIERHPQGGSGMDMHQFWLYQGGAQEIELLTGENLMKQPFDNLMRQRNGVWQKETEYRESFYSTIDTLLSPQGAAAVRRALSFNAVRDASPSDELLELCKERTGYDSIDASKTEHEKLIKRYEDKHGEPPPADFRAGAIDLTKGLRLNFADPKTVRATESNEQS